MKYIFLICLAILCVLPASAALMQNPATTNAEPSVTANNIHSLQGNRFTNYNQNVGPLSISGFKDAQGNVIAFDNQSNAYVQSANGAFVAANGDGSTEMQDSTGGDVKMINGVLLVNGVPSAGNLSSNAVVHYAKAPNITGTLTNIVFVTGCPDNNFNTNYIYDGADSVAGDHITWSNKMANGTKGFFQTNSSDLLLSSATIGNVIFGSGQSYGSIFPSVWPGVDGWQKVSDGSLWYFTSAPYGVVAVATNITSVNVNVYTICDLYGNPVAQVTALTNFPISAFVDASPTHRGIVFAQNTQLTDGGSAEQFVAAFWAAQDPLIELGYADPDAAIEGGAFWQMKNIVFTNGNFQPTEPGKPFRVVMGTYSSGKMLELVSSQFRTNGDGAEVGGSQGIHVDLPQTYAEAYMGRTNTTAGYLAFVDPNTNFATFYPQWRTNLITDILPEGMTVRSNSASGSSGAHYWFLRSGQSVPTANPNDVGTYTGNFNGNGFGVTNFPTLVFTNNPVTPTAASIGANNGWLRCSNNTLWWFSTTDGSSLNSTKITP